jgi:hypothetical protein
MISFRFSPVFCLLWLAAAGVGLFVLAHYEGSAGGVGRTPQRWPEGVEVRRDPGKPTLILFAHPKCPCTRASIEELNRLLARIREKAAAQVFFFRPKGESADWEETALTQSARAIPGVSVSLDEDGKIAKAFGAETSGFTVLYDPEGKLLFRGGITASRGHSGDNAGEASIVSILAGEDAVIRSTAVYGCSLLTPGAPVTNNKGLCTSR